MEHFIFLHRRYYTLDKCCRIFPVGRHSAHRFDDGTEGPEEEFLLDHAFGLDPVLSIEQVRDDEVPYRSMRYAQKNALLLRSRPRIGGPAHSLEQETAEFSPHKV